MVLADGCKRTLARSSTQYDIDAVKNLRPWLGRQVPDPLGEQRPIERDDLRYVGDGILRQPRCPTREKHIPRCPSPGRVARQRHADDRGDAASIQRISLDHDDGPSEAGTGPRRFR